MINNKIFKSPVVLILLTLSTTLFQGGNNIFILALFNIILVFFYKFSNTDNFKNHKLIKFCLCGFLSYLIFQNMPLPNIIGIKLSLQNYELYKDLYQKKFFHISLDLENSIRGFMIFSSSFLILLIVPSLIKNRRSLNACLKLILIFSIFQSIFGIIIYFFNINNIPFLYKKLYYFESVTGTYINRNNFSFFLIISFIISIYYLNFYQKYFLPKSLNIYKFLLSDLFLIRLCILIISIAIILTKSRAGNLTFLIILISIALHDLIKYKKITFLNFSIFSILIIDLIFIGQMVGGDHTLQRFAATSFEGERSRLEVFQIGLNEFLNFPIFGYGLGGFEIIYANKYNDSYLFYDHIHNDIIEYLGELGLIGFLILFIVIPIVIFKTIFVKDQISEIKNITLFSSIALIVHCNLDFSFHIPGNIFYIFLIMGIGLMRQKQNRIT